MRILKFMTVAAATCCVVVLWCGQAQAAIGTLWAGDSGTGSGSIVYNLDATTGAVNSSFVGPGLFADGVEQFGTSLFIADSSTNSTIWETDLVGNVINSFNIASDAEGLTILNNGNLVISDFSGGSIDFYDQAGNFLSSFASPNTVGLDSDGVGTIFGIDINGTITTYDLMGNIAGFFNTGLAGTTLGLAYTGSSFYVAQTNLGLITEVDLVGNFLNSFNAPGPFTEGLSFNGPGGPPGPVIPEPGALMVWSVLAGTCLAVGARRRRTG